MKLHAYVTSVLAMLVAAPAAAQNGAMWVSPDGNLTSFIFRGGDGATPPPMDRAPAEMARLFKSLCVEGSADPASFVEAARATGLQASPIELAGTKKRPPVTIDLWMADGLVLSRSEGHSAVPTPQCNATFYVSTLPDRQSVTDSVSALLGSAPSNIASAVDKKGKPKKYFDPEWTTGNGIVTAFVSKHDRYMPGNRVQISLRMPKADK